MLFVILVLLVAVGLVSPYIAVALKRRQMLRRLVVITAQNGYRIKPLHKFVCFSPNRAGRYDLLIQNKTHAYPVKLWSTAKRSSTLVIKKNGCVYETYGVTDPLRTDNAQRHTVKGRELAVRPTEENFKVRSAKTVIPILLYYPCNKSAVADLGDSRRKIEFGDRIFKKMLCSPTMLEQMLVGDTSEQLPADEKPRIESAR